MQGGAGTAYVKGPASTYGDLIVDNKGATGQSTELPWLGNGTAGAGSAGRTIVTSRTSIPAHFAGHWVEVSTGSTLKGAYRVESIGQASGNATLVLEVVGNPAVAEGDTWQGVYRFDTLTVRNGGFRSTDPVRIPTAILEGTSGAPVVVDAAFTTSSIALHSSAFVVGRPDVRGHSFSGL